MSQRKPTMGETVNPAALRALLNSSEPSELLDGAGYLIPRNPQPREGVRVDDGRGLLEGAVVAEQAQSEQGGTSFQIDPGYAVGALAFMHVMLGNGRRISAKARSKGGVRVTISDINFDGDNLISALMKAATAFAKMEGLEVPAGPEETPE